MTPPRLKFRRETKEEYQLRGDGEWECRVAALADRHDGVALPERLIICEDSRRPIRRIARAFDELQSRGFKAIFPAALLLARVVSEQPELQLATGETSLRTKHGCDVGSYDVNNVVNNASALMQVTHSNVHRYSPGTFKQSR